MIATNRMFRNICFYGNKLGFCIKYVFDTKKFHRGIVAINPSLINFINK